MDTARVSRDMLPASEEVRLAEFAALREEIKQRSSLQHALMVLNLTAVAAVAGLVLGRNADRSLLLVVPVVSPALGFLWFGHHLDIARIGKYIGRQLWVWEPSWEAWCRDAARLHKRWWDQTFWTSLILMFCGAPTIALIIGLPARTSSTATWLLWSGGVVLTISSTARFCVGRSTNLD